MTDHDRLLAAFRAWRGGPLALATVVASWGSAPRPKGSHMLVDQQGRFEGSVSGGCVEGEVLQAAAEILADGGARLLEYGVADERAWEVGLPCGGKIRILVQRIDADGFPPELFEYALIAPRQGETVTVSTDLATGRSRAGPSGDAADFINIYAPPPRLLIVGAVQIAQSLARIALELGMEPVIADPRARFLTAERFPGLVLDDRWPDEAVAAFAPDAKSAVVTLSHDSKIDDPALIAALASPAGYVAALGSRRSHAQRIERLLTAGCTEAQVARIDAPAGIAINAVGPAEIALSVAAGMVAQLRRVRG